MPVQTQNPTLLLRIARIPRLRALAWDGDVLYAARAYELLQGRIVDDAEMNWKSAGRFHPGWKRRLSVANRLTARLFRDGFHALTVLPDGGLIAAVPGSIVTLRPGETEFRQTHAITRGTRPLHITAVPDGSIYWGEYFDNSSRDEVHIYASSDGGASWSVVYTFPRDAIRTHPQHSPRSMAELPVDPHRRLRRRMPHHARQLQPEPDGNRDARQAAGPGRRRHCLRRWSLFLFRHAAGAKLHLPSRPPRNTRAISRDWKFVDLWLSCGKLCVLLYNGRAERSESRAHGSHLRRRQPDADALALGAGMEKRCVANGIIPVRQRIPTRWR